MYSINILLICFKNINWYHFYSATRWRCCPITSPKEEFRSGPQNRHEESKFQSCIPNIVSILLCRNPHQHDLMKVVLNMDKIPLKPSDPYFKVYSIDFTTYSLPLLLVNLMNLVPFNYYVKTEPLIESRIWWILNR